MKGVVIPLTAPPSHADGSSIVTISFVWFGSKKTLRLDPVIIINQERDRRPPDRDEISWDLILN